MQATSLLCDHCSQEVERDNRVQMIIFTTVPIADPQIDLCMDCATPLLNNPAVKSAHAKAQEQVEQDLRARYPEPVNPDPELPPDTYEQQGGNPRS